MSKFETYVITSGSWDSSILPLPFNQYKGVIYYIVGPGGIPTTVGSPISVNLGGSSGFVNTGYFDFTNPYVIDRIDVSIGSSPGQRTSLSASVFSGSPANGVPIIVYADSGVTPTDTGYTTYEYIDNVSGNPKFLSGFYGPGNGNYFNTSVNQRLENIGATGASPQGGVTSEFSQNVGATGFGGGGFYGGVGSAGPYGYGSGGAIDGNPGTGGYAVLSFIPTTMVTSTVFNGTSEATGMIALSGLCLYNGVGGGGGGGAGYYDGKCYAGGGGGSGEQRYGFANLNPTDVYYVGGGGIAGNGVYGYPGGDGGTSVIGSVEIVGGQGGYAAAVQFNASGGYGWYGGGRAVGPEYVQFDGTARTYIPTNFPTNNASTETSSNGGGIVNLNFGQGNYAGSGPFYNAGGGGGGWYGGNAGYNNSGSSAIANDVQTNGYGCGGGGGAQSFGGSLGGFGTAGYWGYILVNQLDTTNLSYSKITSNTFFNFFQLKDYKGVWFFLSGDKYVNAPFDNNVCVNTGHFLIKEDNVRTISITKDLAGYFTITFTFSILNGKTQTFRMKATTPQPYMDLLLYV